MFPTRHYNLTAEQEPKLLKPRPNIFPHDIVNGLADSLQRSNEGDIIFESPSIKDGNMKVLYAHSSVLKARSRYYVNSKSVETTILILQCSPVLSPRAILP